MLPEVSLGDLADKFFLARPESKDNVEELTAARCRSRFPAPAEHGSGGGSQRSSTARYARDRGHGVFAAAWGLRVAATISPQIELLR